MTQRLGPEVVAVLNQTLPDYKSWRPPTLMSAGTIAHPVQRHHLFCGLLLDPRLSAHRGHPALKMGAETDYASFRERYQYTLYDSPVCLPISARLAFKTLYIYRSIMPLRDDRFFVERGAVLRVGKALVELLPVTAASAPQTRTDSPRFTRPDGAREVIPGTWSS